MRYPSTREGRSLGFEVTLNIFRRGCRTFFDPVGRTCDVLKTPHLHYCLLPANLSINEYSFHKYNDRFGSNIWLFFFPSR